jgi:hypothetical protein|tara:strand:+ start:720 stop:1151 length:432 start_codon:yes stop_codon:yes gene_type:complete
MEVTRFKGGDFKNLLNDNNKFILLVYYEGQILESHSTFLSILPSWELNDNRNQNVEIMNTFTGVTYVETYHNESYDLVSHFGISYEDIWDSGNNGHYIPLIIGVKNGWITKTSVGMCYCAETYIDILNSVYPELFIPPSVSES